MQSVGIGLQFWLPHPQNLAFIMRDELAENIEVLATCAVVDAADFFRVS